MAIWWPAWLAPMCPHPRRPSGTCSPFSHALWHLSSWCIWEKEPKQTFTLSSWTKVLCVVLALAEDSRITNCTCSDNYLGIKELSEVVYYSESEPNCHRQTRPHLGERLKRDSKGGICDDWLESNVMPQSLMISWASLWTAILCQSGHVFEPGVFAQSHVVCQNYSFGHSRFHEREPAECFMSSAMEEGHKEFYFQKRYRHNGWWTTWLRPTDPYHDMPLTMEHSCSCTILRGTLTAATWQSLHTFIL